MTPNPAHTGIVKFEVGVPQILAIAQSVGKPVQSRFGGDQLLFTLTDGRKMYVDPYVQDRMIAAGVVPSVPFEICKTETWINNRRVVDFRIGAGARTPAPVPFQGSSNGQHHNPTPAAPPALPPPPAPPVAMNGSGETGPAIMARCFLAAIDVALASTAYAESKGLRITPAFEDIRAMAATLVIQEGGRR